MQTASGSSSCRERTLLHVSPWLLLASLAIACLWWVLANLKTQEGSGAPPSPGTSVEVAKQETLVIGGLPSSAADRLIAGADTLDPTDLERLDAIMEMAMDPDKVGILAKLVPLLDALPPRFYPVLARSLEGVPAERDPALIRDELFKRWGACDGPAAFSYAIKSESGLDGGLAAMRAWVQVSTSGPLEWLNAVEPPNMRAYLGRFYTAVFLMEDYRLAHGAVERMSDPTMREWSYLQIAHTALASNMPDRLQEVREWFSSRSADPSSSEGAAQMVSDWAMVDLHGAVRWTFDLPPGEVRQAVWRALIAQWAAQDPVGLGDWLDYPIHTLEWESAVAAYASKVAADDRSTARAWAATIQDPELREAALRRINEFGSP